MKEKDYREIALSGLEKLADGKINDIMRIMFSADKPDSDDIDKINFMSVSEIKRDKDGGIQVKFFDRQAAFETLYKFASESTSNSEAENFLRNLCES